MFDFFNTTYYIDNQYFNTIVSDSNMITIFSDIEDHRSHINKLHSLVYILLIGVISVICGTETWKQMTEFSNSKEDFLRKFLDLKNGIPYKDTINRIF